MNKIIEEFEFFSNRGLSYIDELKDIIKNLEKKIIPYEYPAEVQRKFDIEAFMHREKVISIQGFSLLTEQWVSLFATWIGNRKCLEVMSGCGSLAYALKNKGIDIIATDNNSWCKNIKSKINWIATDNVWCDIEEIDCVEAIEKYGSEIDIIIISWAYMDSNSYKCLLKMREKNPNAVMVYIGEGYGGCTGNDDFYDAIEVVEDQNIDAINEVYPTWFGIYDRIWLVK